MKKTLLLCFIHGFKGGDDTFGNFPSHLKAVLQHALPNVKVLEVTYPKYETRGDLGECVGRFREWLLNKIIDLEVANATPSPTVDPSVHTILVGHSMGGIVAAETLLSIVNEQPIHSQSTSQSSEPGSLMFPYIHGILAFDTPYLGIAPGVVAHGAEKHWATASSAYAAYNNLAGAFGWGAKSSDGASTAVGASKMIASSQTTATAAKAVNDANSGTATVPLWQKYGKAALVAGAAGAVAAGGAAAYLKRGQISEGWAFATSHLEFVGSLARPEELRRRLANVVRLSEELHVGFANMYTALGHAVNAQNEKKAAPWTGKVAGIDRTFCNLPKGELKRFFIPAVNDKATEETWAHMSMFEPRSNPGYYTMSETAKETIVEWVEGTAWYSESEAASSGMGTGGVVLDDEEGGDEDEMEVEEGFEKVQKPQEDNLANPWRDEL
ncbi:uncharacterized protein EI97DRAFT_458137 [Westerdykella ornata]|uniref:DUF676 domain-containing protein n=1 Tax=Westerdykella ornata TaxID=318751 RepID=A0A6A6JL19_WESOR|nr:uncharacterized protein EI97DRAFT_458137 [Westerdykella ornata]KAF2276803.1 hypothetical protein EI97DRAFT_458137 [Westerdykella ornata]